MTEWQTLSAVWVPRPTSIYKTCAFSVGCKNKNIHTVPKQYHDNTGSHSLRYNVIITLIAVCLSLVFYRYSFNKNIDKKWLAPGVVFKQFLADIIRMWPAGLQLLQVGVSLPISDICKPYFRTASSAQATPQYSDAEPDSDDVIRLFTAIENLLIIDAHRIECITFCVTDRDNWES